MDSDEEEMRAMRSSNRWPPLGSKMKWISLNFIGYLEITWNHWLWSNCRKGMWGMAGSFYSPHAGIRHAWPLSCVKGTNFEALGSRQHIAVRSQQSLDGHMWRQPLVDTGGVEQKKHDETHFWSLAYSVFFSPAFGNDEGRNEWQLNFPSGNWTSILSTESTSFVETAMDPLKRRSVDTTLPYLALYVARQATDKWVGLKLYNM